VGVVGFGERRDASMGRGTRREPRVRVIQGGPWDQEGESAKD
jgi:hypothetical protein